MFEIKYKGNKLEYLSEKEWEQICDQTAYKVCSREENGLTLFCLLESEQNVRNTAGLYSQNIQPGDKTKKGCSLELIKTQ